MKGNICPDLSLEIQSACQNNCCPSGKCRMEMKTQSVFSKTHGACDFHLGKYSLLLLRRDPTHSSLTTIPNCSLLFSSNDYGDKGATKCPAASPLPRRWAEICFFFVETAPVRCCLGGALCFPTLGKRRPSLHLRY